jgi:GT2 family glycosyltransferase
VEPPSPDAFLSGRVGFIGPRRAVAMRALDRLLDLELRARRAVDTLDRLAADVPRRDVLALCVHRDSSTRLGAISRELAATRHNLRPAFGRMGDGGLTGGKFENLNLLLAEATPHEFDWLLVVDDDVVLPERFVDRLLGLCERLDLALAQPAQTRASHAAWPVTRRVPGSLARETSFVEIGPVTAIRRDAVRLLTPFPELRFGWGLDLHWGALAREQGWRLGVLDALPVRHDEGGVASRYAHHEAVAEARSFLTGRPFVPATEANATLAIHRRLR